MNGSIKYEDYYINDIGIVVIEVIDGLFGEEGEINELID